MAGSALTVCSAFTTLDSDMDVTPDGTIYLGSCNALRRLTPAGVSSLVAGAVDTGYVDGPGASARFNGISGVVVDAQGTVYVSDSRNNCIRRISSAGVVSTLAGSRQAGSADGPAAVARFNYPMRLTLDAQGNLFVYEKLNYRIRKITPQGDVSTVAGSTMGIRDDAGPQAQFTAVLPLAISPQGTLYASDMSYNRLCEIAPDGRVRTINNPMRDYADGLLATTARTNAIAGLDFASDGTMYLADYINRRIRRVSPKGEVTTIAGNGTRGNADGTGSDAQFGQFQDLELDAQGNIYVMDYGNNVVRKIRQK